MYPVQNDTPTCWIQRGVNQTELPADIYNTNSGPDAETQGAEAVYGQERTGFPQGFPAQDGQRPDCRVYQVAKGYALGGEKRYKIGQYWKHSPPELLPVISKLLLE